MFSENNEGQQGLALTVVFALVVLVVAMVIGIGVQQGGARLKARPAVTIPVAASLAPVPGSPLTEEAASAAARAQAASDAASIQVEQGVVKFYFASGKAELAAGAGDALADMVKAAQAGQPGRKLVIAGFHDDTGDAGRNAELARRRALAVRAALKAAGVADAQIELAKPRQLTGSGSDADARRVEISLQ
ncbi:MAG: OmpA family protein [Polaromonas sp.]|uniref:OmpA family protein n=1 Tax=Polaromonas sp. TaxID=1869339 RepID=UPI00272F38F4|nr:OmpA family protein [Polaromonas sp.]MDP2255619.1 OmpA family protein [Polaromonas sp.]